VAEKRPLRDCIEADQEIAPYFDKPALDALFTPENQLGSAPELTRRAVAAWHGQSQS
jgi:hypothetical protein